MLAVVRIGIKEESVDRHIGILTRVSEELAEVQVPIIFVPVRPGGIRQGGEDLGRIEGEGLGAGEDQHGRLDLLRIEERGIAVQIEVR